MKNSFISTLCKENIDNPRIILYKINEVNPTVQTCLTLNKDVDSKGREMIPLSSLIAFLSILNIPTSMILLMPNQILSLFCSKISNGYLNSPKPLQGPTRSYMIPLSF